ncbi:polysaccharide export protein [bacterium]|nr:polysaccharide export protein [bacterium]
MLLLGGCGGGAARAPVLPAASPAMPATENRLRIGDELQIRLDTSGTQAGAATGPELVTVTIDENGEISLKLVGRVTAAGSSPRELSERIEAHYVPRFYVRMNVTVTVAPRFFYVMGEVRNPGRFGWSDDTTVLKAISTAGSFTDYANRRQLEVIRGKERFLVDTEELRRNPQKDPAVRPGDTVLVPRSIF